MLTHITSLPVTPKAVKMCEWVNHRSDRCSTDGCGSAPPVSPSPHIAEGLFDVSARACAHCERYLSHRQEYKEVLFGWARLRPCNPKKRTGMVVGVGGINIYFFLDISACYVSLGMNKMESPHLTCKTSLGESEATTRLNK